MKLNVTHALLTYPKTTQEHTAVGVCMEDDTNLYSGPFRKVHLAMDGTTFDLISKYDKSLMDKVCVTGTIFARLVGINKSLLSSFYFVISSSEDTAILNLIRFILSKKISTGWVIINTYLSRFILIPNH